jgi:hypothetical protein
LFFSLLKALFEPPRLSKDELDMVSNVVKLLVTVTGYKVFPSPASKLMKLIIQKEQDKINDKAAQEEEAAKQDQNGGGGRNRRASSMINRRSLSHSASPNTTPKATAAGASTAFNKHEGSESDLPGPTDRPRPMTSDENAALEDMLKLSPLLRTLLGLLAEPESGVDAGAVALLQQVFYILFYFIQKKNNNNSICFSLALIRYCS